MVRRDRWARAATALAVVLAAAAAAVRPAAAGDPPPVDAAEAALAAGRLAEAEAAFRALADAPGGAADARVQAGLARALALAGKARGALEPAAAAVRLRGDAEDRLRYAELLVGVARAAVDAGPRSGLEVMPYLRDALGALAPMDGGAPPAARRRAALEGEARWLAGDLAGARRWLDDPALRDDPRMQDLRARAAYAAGDFGAAAEAWGLAGVPRGVALARSLAGDRRAVDDYAALVKAAPTDLDLADEACRAALALGGVDALDAAWTEPPPGTPALRRLRGRLAERAGRLAAAVEHYRAARALLPDDPAILADFARARLGSGPDDPAGVDEAVAVFVEVLRRRPDDAWARQALEFVARRDADAAPREWPDRTRLQRTVAALRAVVDADPSDGTAWTNLGNALRTAGDTAGALDAFEKAVEANPYDAGAWNDRGIARLAAGDVEGALASFAKATALDPGATAPLQNAGRLRRLTGDLDGAVRDTAAAIGPARALGGHPDLYRSMLDRVWRARRAPR